MASSKRLSAGGLLFSGVALAAAVALSVAPSAEAFAPQPASAGVRTRIGGGGGSPTTSTTALCNRSARRKDKKKKKRRSQPAFVVDDEEDSAAGGVATAASKNEPILLGGGEIGFTNEVPDSSKIPVATTTSKDRPPKKSKLDQELSGERIQEEGVVGESVTSAASVSDMPLEPGQAQPDVTTVVTDPETGIKRIQQGKYVADKVTGKRVVLSSMGPEYRLAQMFPGVPPDVRDKHRFDWKTVTVPDMVEKLREACTVPLKNSATGEEWLGIPPHPQVSNPAVDFVLSNRDHLGHRMQKALGRLKMRAQSQFNKEEASELRVLWKHLLLLEDHISAPFRQILLDAEAKVGPNFGNLDVKSYCSGEVYERAANYLVLKSMVAHWEKKYNDAIELDKIPDDEGINFLNQLYTGDPKRYLPDPPIIFRLDEVSRIVVMAQKMCQAFCDEPELFDDLPPEVKFVEKALSIQGGTALRRYILEDFCPGENVDPASIREGLKRLYQQMFNMQSDPYGDLTMTLWNLCAATAVGTDDARDPYEEYIANVRGTGYDTNPGYFQTYTFDHDKNSMVRFLDSAKVVEKGTAGSTEDVARQVQGEALQLLGFDFGGGGSPNPAMIGAEKEKKQGPYVVPEDRAIGRPHMMGWLELLGDDHLGGDGDNMGTKEEGAAAKREEVFEADQWEEVKAA
ncbi:hypothetical protein ACHAWF_018848 [Thalassiosira exigua]